MNGRPNIDGEIMASLYKSDAGLRTWYMAQIEARKGRFEDFNENAATATTATAASRG